MLQIEANLSQTQVDQISSTTSSSHQPRHPKLFQHMHYLIYRKNRRPLPLRLSLGGCTSENAAKFLDILHSAIKEGLKEGVDEIQKATAIQAMDGWMHIHDQRNIPALNRIGDPDDIIGTVLVENSEILPETYQPMLAYRLVTSDGLMQLTPGLAKKLQDTLTTVSNAERASRS